MLEIKYNLFSDLYYGTIIPRASLRISLAIYDLVSNKGEWNDCFSKFQPSFSWAAASKGNYQWRLFDELRWWAYVIYAIAFPNRCVKTRQTNIQFFLWHLFYRFRKFGATRTNKPFGNITVNVAVTNS